MALKYQDISGYFSANHILDDMTEYGVQLAKDWPMLC